MEDKKIEGVIRKIEALLNTKGCTEAEAETRTAKAQELLEAYNLDMAEIGNAKIAQRKDATKKGGLYSWQRKLWKSVAEMNFCYYLSIKGLERGSQYQHRVIGSHANVIATEMMATYLQQTIERHAQQWAKDNFYKSVFVREAIAYREGMTSRISERLQARRDEMVREEERKAKERQRDEAAKAAAPGTTALTILDVISTETDLNSDYLNHWEPGTTARKRHQRELEWQEHLRKAKEREANKTPEQKAAEEEQRRKDYEEWEKRERARQRRADKRPYKPRYRKPTPEEERMGMGSFYEGRRKGEEVGIDTQVDEDKKRRIV